MIKDGIINKKGEVTSPSFISITEGYSLQKRIDANVYLKSLRVKENLQNFRNEKVRQDHANWQINSFEASNPNGKELLKEHNNPNFEKTQVLLEEGKISQGEADYLDAVFVKRTKGRVVKAQDLSELEVEAIIEEYRDTYEDWATLEKQMKQWNDAVLDLAVENGIITSEERGWMRAKGEHYFPLSRAYENTAQGTANIATGSIASPFRQQDGDTMDTLDGFGVAQDNLLVLNKAIWQKQLHNALREMSKIKGAGKHIEQVDFETKETQVITMVHEGKREFYHIQDPHFYNALTYSNASADVTFAVWNAFIKPIITFPTKAITATAILNPLFILKNLLIDPLTAAIQSTSGSIPYINSLSGLMKLANKNLMRDYEISGAGHSIFARAEADVNKELISKSTAAKFIKNMISNSSILSSARDSKVTKALGEVVATPIRYMDYIASATEIAPRLDEFDRVYKKAIKRGASRESALQEGAFAAKNLTVDFSKNGWITKEVNQYTPFFNARVQGTVNMITTLMTPGGMARFGAFIVAPGLLLWAINKDDEEYQEHSEFDKDNYFFIPKMWKIEEGESKFLKLPIARGYNDLLAFMRRSLEQATGSERKEVDKRVEDIKSMPLDYLMSSLPPIFKIPIEIHSNFSFFRERQLVNDFYKGTALESQFNDWTSESAKFIGPKIGMSPIIFDHMVTSTFTRYAQLVNTGINDVLVDNSLNPDKDFNKSIAGNLTGLGTFFASRPTYNAKSLSDLTFLVDRLNGLKKDKKQLSKEAFAEREETFSELIKDEKKIRSAFSRVKILTRQVRALYDHKTFTPKEKRERIDKLYVDMLKIARRALGKTSQ